MSAQISVIIPIYNAEKTIERCVDSLMCGEEKNIEIILVDDFSTDESWEKCLRLKGKYHNVYCSRNTCNKGVSYTRNQGLNLANGKYVLFVDSDDWVSKEYVSTLIGNAEAHKEKFILCGYTYVNQINHTEQQCIYSRSIRESIVEPRNYFSLIDTVLIQQLWNKVFLLDVIREHNIYFDEEQSMGEDFQFVLEYMEVAKIKECLILNQPLYYYVRATTTSLMSKMEIRNFENSLYRINKLAKIAGLVESVEHKKQIENLKKNYLYHIVHDSNITNRQKIENIESIMKDGKAKQYYHRLRFLMIREQFGEVKNVLKIFK